MLLERLMIVDDIEDNLVDPYVSGKKTLKEAIDDYYARILSKNCQYEDEFEDARDTFDVKMTTLQWIIELKRLSKVDGDYEILIEYFEDAIKEFKEACKNRATKKEEK